MNVRTPTCKVDTSTGPLSCPTRKNSTVTVLSVRREVPARWLNSGKARARAQAEAKASDRSHTICSTERQSCAEDGRGARAGPGRRLPCSWGSRRGRTPPCIQSDTGAPTGGLPQTTASTWEKEDMATRGYLRPSKTGRGGTNSRPLSRAQSCRPDRSGRNGLVSLASASLSGAAVTVSGLRQHLSQSAPRSLCGHPAVTRGRGPPPLSTHHDAPMRPRRQAGPHQSGDEVRSRGAVVAAHAWGQGGHGGAVQVQGTAVRGVGVERA